MVTTSENSQQWIGAHENYSFSENNGATTLTIELVGENMQADANIAEMFEDIWPNALDTLKEISEK